MFGRKQERGIAREAIADKAACYAQAKTKLSKERAKHLAVTAVDILRGFFRSKIDYSTLFAAAEIEDTVIDEMSEQHKKQDHKIDDLAKSVQDNSLLSIDKNVSLANSGKIDAVEKNVAAFFAGLGTTHALTPYYGFTMDGVSCLKSIGETACSFSCSLGMHVELFDQKLDFNIIRKIDSMRLDNFEKITKKIDALDNGDPIKVSFVSGNTDPNIHYSDMFYSEETAKNLLKETVS